MAKKLKVFSAQLGFVRAVVAAPSRAAALQAWGVHDDLFKRGTAVEETDAGLIAEATASPGEVLRRPIGDAAALVAAATKPGVKASSAPQQAKPKAATPPPDRTALEMAEAALAAARSERAKALKALAVEQKALDARRAKIEDDGAVEAAERERDAAHAAYDKALKAWTG
ncbi:hypothetical protein BH09PSE2_BH09PSE2_07560 [soil metagenome]